MGNDISGTRNSGMIEIEKQRDLAMESLKFAEIVDETNGEKIDQDNLHKKDYKKPRTIRYIYYALGVLETLLAFRFVLKIFGANTGSAFVSGLYSITDIFLAPFTGIFSETVSDGIEETASIVEPKLIVGMIVYALLVVGIVKLIEITKKNKNI